MEKVFHLGLCIDDLKGAKLAIVPGDPDRAARISQFLDNPTCLAHTREFH
nr:uridine phosphorylase [Pseudoalteromonas sp.]